MSLIGYIARLGDAQAIVDFSDTVRRRCAGVYKGNGDMTVLITRSCIRYSAYIGNIGIDSVENSLCTATIGKGAIRSRCDIGISCVIGTRLTADIVGCDFGEAACIVGLLIIIVSDVERVCLTVNERGLIRRFVYVYMRNNFALKIIGFVI